MNHAFVAALTSGAVIAVAVTLSYLNMDEWFG